MKHYLGFKEGDGNEAGIADVKGDGCLQNVFVEERYNRKKYSGCFPAYSLINVCTNRSNEDEFVVSEHFPKEYELLKKMFKNTNVVKTPKLLHHLSHAYESYYTSGFDRAAILVIDGCGDNYEYNVNEKESITFYHKVGKEIKELKKYYLPDSLGMFYATAGGQCGFDHNEEGHFMGLSAYGKPSDERYISIQNGAFVTNKDFNSYHLYYDTLKDSMNIVNAINYAATIQRDLNECVMELVKDIKRMTNEDNLCLSGGVFNNVITNNIICESGIFKNVWCSPVPSDFGLAIGKAYITYEANEEDIKNHRLNSAYGGEEFQYNDEKVLDFFNNNNINYKEIKNKTIVEGLINGKVFAWFQGGSEFGRRALGHRSLIANPEYPKMYNLLSCKIKKRAPYRPLACTVPDELFDKMFDVKNKDLTEFMLRAIPIRKEIIPKVYNCTAIDGTTRPQRLRREVNPEFYDLIMDFYNKTNVPCVINTSLNGGGEPIVESLIELNNFLIKHPEVNGAIVNGKYYFECKINYIAKN